MGLGTGRLCQATSVRGVLIKKRHASHVRGGQGRAWVPVSIHVTKQQGGIARF